MAAYESAEKDSAFVDISEYVEEREFDATEMASPDVVEQVFQTM